MFDAGKTRMIGLPYGEKYYDDMLSRFHPIPGRYHRGNKKRYGRTDGQNCYIKIARQCAPTYTPTYLRDIVSKTAQGWLNLAIANMSRSAS